ncbi:MAG TPA: hypothetical protein VH062_15420 [Polyangiaceae bacterium]|nr:hypothetical protein [Polyangiaceae bacterium]
MHKSRTARCPQSREIDDTAFFKDIAPDLGATGAGEDVLFSLFDLRSTANYDKPNGEVYWHNVTNSATELSNFTVQTQSQPWSVSGLELVRCDE